MPRTYPLTSAAIVASVGAGIFCLDLTTLGRSYPLHDERPGPALNARRHRMSDGSTRWLTRAGVLAASQASPRADLPSGAAHVIAPVETASALIRVDISGPLEQRAGYHDPCSGWTDGHDAVAERLCAAFTEGDVLLVVDSPGGAAAGLQQAVARVLAAKATHGRRVTVWADEMIGSAAVWWAFSVGDEVFIPEAGQVGSIGARGEHVDISGALAKEGVRKTYFADPPEKVALAREFPLSPVGEARGMRDVSLAADAFRAAVCASPLGMRGGLTPEYLIALGADMLTGQAAVDAGLADSVETFDTVTAYALGLAESGERPADATTTGARSAIDSKGDRAMPNVRAEGDEPEKDPDSEGPTSERGIDPPSKCQSCSVQNEEDAKFCKGCGASMATGPKMDDEPEKEPPSSKPMPGKAEPPKMMAPARMATDASLASILGADGDSPLAIKTAAIRMRQIRDTAAGVTGKSNPGEIVGALLNVPGKIERGAQALNDLADNRAKADATERRDLCMRLVKTGAVERTKVLDDGATVDGRRAEVPRIRSRYATMDLDVLRGTVTDLEESAAKSKPKRANPFAPDETRAEAEALARDPRALPSGEPSEAQIAAAMQNPVVKQMAAQTGYDLKTVAKTHLMQKATLASRNGQVIS